MCEEKGCHWSDYTKGEEWGYYSKTDIGCFECQKSCNLDENCGGVECDSGYCSWWKLGKCSTLGEYNANYHTCRKRLWFMDNANSNNKCIYLGTLKKIYKILNNTAKL